jgi:hypothetical protein
MQEVAGSNGAGLIWRDLMISYHTGRPVLGFTRPPNVNDAMVCAATGALAGPDCPNPYSEHFVAGSEPQTSDITLAKVKVGGDGSCLAASYTPPNQVREMTFVVYPPQYRTQAASTGVPQPPTQYCPPPVPQPGQLGTAVAAFSVPMPEAIIKGQVLVRGTARGSYTLEVGSGRDPQQWQTISNGSSAVADGILGTWQSTSLAVGPYTLRLRVITADGVPADARVIVRVER